MMYYRNIFRIFVKNTNEKKLLLGRWNKPINLNELEKFHKNHGKIATITAVQPPARFGGLELDGDKVLSFREKSILDQSWINGGFFIFKKKKK